MPEIRGGLLSEFLSLITNCFLVMDPRFPFALVNMVRTLEQESYSRMKDQNIDCDFKNTLATLSI